jgi:hypothetical protein
MLCRFVSVAAALFLSVVPVFGQGFATAEFNGSVVAQSGDALPGVTTTVTEETTGLVQTVVSHGQPEFDEALACQPRMLQLGFRFAF